MAGRTSVVLLESSQYRWEYTGDAINVNGVYGFVDGKYTIAVYTSRLIGRIWIEASLANEPTESDWFPIHIDGNTPYLDFDYKVTPIDQTIGVTFQANVVWLRARLDRSHIIELGDTKSEAIIMNYGTINRILLNG